MGYKQAYNRRPNSARLKLVEGKEEILIIDSKKTRKLHAGVLNWDQSGSPEKNKEYLAKNKQLYELEVMQKKIQGWLG